MRVPYNKSGSGQLKMQNMRGFTVIEVLLVVTIMAILVSLAVPSFKNSIRDNKVETAANALMSGFAIARNEAIRRGVNVNICAVADPTVTTPVCGTNWALGWAIFIDGTGGTANVIDAGEVFRVGDAASSVTITGGVTALKTFNNRGTVTTGSGDLIINSTSCTSGVNKKITVTLGPVGRTQTTVAKC